MSLHRSSVFSFSSLGYTGKQIDEIPFEDMSTDELRQMLEEVVQENWIMALENDIFERYLMRLDPQSLKSIARILEKAKQTQRLVSQMQCKQSRISLHGPDSVKDLPTLSISAFDTRPEVSSSLTPKPLREKLKISRTHRMDMAKKEIEEMRKKLLEFEHMVQKKKKNLRAEMEELEIRIREAQEAKDDFEEEVVIRGVDPVSGKLPAEKIVRFVEDWLRIAEAAIERLRLKSTAIKSQIKKVKLQLIHRRELGEALRAVDFEQLEIENQDYAGKIEEKNHRMLETKKITGRHSLLLTRYKQKDNDLEEALRGIRSDKTIKQQQIQKLNSDKESVQNCIDDLNNQLSSLLKLIKEYKIPEVLEYIKLQAEHQQLLKTYKRLYRRKQIQEITLKSNKKKMRESRDSKSDDNSTF